MKILMGNVFEALYQRDSEMLGQIIKEYGYLDETSEKKTYDFEEFIGAVEKLAKENGIEMEDVATRIVNTCEISGNNIDEMKTKLAEIKPEVEMTLEEFIKTVEVIAKKNKISIEDISIGIAATNYFTEDHKINMMKEIFKDEFEDETLKANDIKRIIKGALGEEIYKKVFYEAVETDELFHLINEAEDSQLSDILIQFDYIHDERSENEKTKEYGKLYIEQLIKDKNSEEAISIDEQLRSNGLLPDGEETLIALCNTNFEQVVDTIMSTKTVLALDLTNITSAAETVLNNMELKREIKRIKKERKNNG